MEFNSMEFRQLTDFDGIRFLQGLKLRFANDCGWMRRFVVQKNTFDSYVHLKLTHF
jgi:hypothetical protein